jgi:hypothetical protein
MSGFILTQRASKAYQCLVNAKEAFTRKSYALNFHTVELKDHVLVLYEDNTSVMGKTHVGIRDNFYCYCGFLIFEEKSGKEALQALETALFKGRKLADLEFHGNYFLLIYHEGNLQITRDLFGGYTCYSDENCTWYTSNFVAAMHLIEKVSFSNQELTERLFFGFEFGFQTIVKGIVLTPPSKIIDLTNDIQVTKRIPIPELEHDLNKCISQNVEVIASEFSLYHTLAGNNIVAALSGGFDSRLMLAGMLNSGTTPELYVYGADNCRDVTVAKNITKKENLKLSHLSKSMNEKEGLEQILNTVMQNFWDLDGAKNLFLNKIELQSRMDRAIGGKLVLNGSGGEIFRDIWKWDFKTTTWLELFLNSYNTGELEFFGVDVPQFFENIVYKVKQQAADFFPVKETLSRREAEMLFLIYRSNFYAQNNNLNNYFGDATFPFLSARVALSSFSVPFEMKRAGKFEASLIKTLHPKIASYPSEYGFDFYHGPNKKTIIKEWAYSQLSPSFKSQVKKLLSSSNKSAFNTSKIKNAYLDDQVLVELLGDKQPLAHKLFENSTKILNQNTKSRLFSMELMYMMGKMMHEVDPFANSSMEEESLAVD